MYKTNFQGIVVLSSTEAKFIVACDAGKNSLYIQSIMEDIGLEQTEATIIFKDNQGAIVMTNAGKPTKRTRNIDTRHFPILLWVEQDLIKLRIIPTGNNSDDAMTKDTLKIIFICQKDHIMGNNKPEYVTPYVVQHEHIQSTTVLSKGG